jgi:hypothetical protein
MKKARIILLCMLVLGTVGGVVAFKANAFETKRITSICYSFPVNGVCISPYLCNTTWKIRTTPLGTPVCYTLYIPGIPCSSLLCTLTATVVIE